MYRSVQGECDVDVDLSRLPFCQRTSGNHEKMDRILKNIDELWSELAIKLEESKDQKVLNRIIKKLSK